jgi:hypothetical protein
MNLKGIHLLHIPLVFAFLAVFIFSAVGCGRSFKAERDAYARTAYHIADSTEELAQATPADAPTRPGIEILKVETRAVAESLPAPEAAKRMQPIPFVAAVEAATQAESLALSAGKSEPEAKALSSQAAAAVVAGQSQVIDLAIQEYRAAAADADAATGLLGAVGNAAMSVVNLFGGPIGGTITGLLGAGFALFSAWRRRRVQDGLVATIKGIDDAVDAAKAAYKEKGLTGLTDEEVKAALYSALQSAHEALPNAKAFMDDVVRIKAQYRAS